MVMLRVTRGYVRDRSDDGKLMPSNRSVVITSDRSAWGWTASGYRRVVRSSLRGTAWWVTWLE